jgi:hypothetical protein
MRLVVLPVLLCAAAVAAHAGGITPNLTRNCRSAQVNYMTECQGCHLPDGSGQKGSVPSMKDELHRFLNVDGGREFLVQVPGSANSKLSDADLAALLNWLIPKMGGMKAEGFKSYTPEEIAAYRSDRLVDVTGTRAALVAKFDQPETSSVN